MGVVIGEVMPLALAIALSPFPVVPAILLLFTPRPRATGAAFLAGWAAGIAVAAGVAAVLASVVELYEGTPTWAAWTKTALGLLLVVLGARQWRARGGKETPAWVRSLADTTPARALRLGLLLSAANPKVLLLAAAGGLTIGSADLTPAGSAAALAVLTAVAAATVALPLLLHTLVGDRVLGPLGRAKDWLETHNAAVTALVLAVVGAVLTAEGLAAL
ncbi:GAP family protein [Streptacidiphilus sp. ASG 303]|uniref:GAP family protein n=1 Tax=Streptacidiphilus sp. ASG 303 TaxID=2896847 RepID=UPI001E44400F|nr:GAP family protein [Streptacidiphilus sp. ASG 303]MCD0484527.1 GAP family protein [Streptacidiphilus sp. ASG 303]